MADSSTPSLLPGERVLWAGQPSSGIVFTPMDRFLIPFSLLWAGFAVFWNASVWLSDAPIFFRLWGLPFLLAGAYIAVGRFFHDRHFRRKTSYRVTDKRIIIDRAGRSQKSLDVRRLPQIELSERADGTGTIRFGTSPNMFGANGLSIWSPALDPTPQFVRIERARNAYDIIQRAAATPHR